jgi:hypothetical protein
MMPTTLLQEARPPGARARHRPTMFSGETVADLAFLALFPGFFFYQSAIGAGIIGPVLGGYFSLVAFALLPPLLFVYSSRIMASRSFFTSADLAFCCFIAYFLFIVALNYAGGAEPDVSTHHALSISHLVAVFIIFRLADFHRQTMRRVALLSLLLMSIVIFMQSGEGSFYLENKADGDESSGLATYQGFARSYLVTLLAVAPFAVTRRARIVLYLFAVPALYLNGARSELLVSIALVMAIEVFHARHKLTVLMMFLALFGAVIWNADELIRMLPHNRTLELLESFSSSSVESRNMLFAHALETIGRYPLLGEYGGYFTVHGPGSYVHNIFSAWVDIGLFGFVYLLLMILVPTAHLGMEIARPGNLQDRLHRQELLLAFGVLFVTVLMVFSAKSFTYMVIGGALGRYAHYRSTYVTGTYRPPHLGAPARRFAHFPQAVP